MPSNFFTNQGENSLLRKFEGVLTNMQSIQQFDALVGYFRASGYFKVRPFLENIQKIRILVGINVDKLTQEFHSKGQLYIKNPDRTREEFDNQILENIQESEYDEATEKGILQFIDDLITEKIELRAHPEKKIHAKVYIFRPTSFNEYSSCEVITGSSNMTDAGLGTNPESNYEFNVSLRDYDDVKFATDEFENLWNESHQILKADAEAIKKKSYLSDTATPFQIYIKMLMEYFGNRVEYDPYNIDLLLPDKYKRLKYQSDAANQGYAIMMKHNGFILADVVGLGKTIIACMIAKKFIYENGAHTKILIVFPPALESTWRKIIDDLAIKNHIEFVSNGSLNKVINPEEHQYHYSSSDRFDMIIVDESHKFRNDYTDRFKQLQQICKTRRVKPSETGDDKKKIILVTATPLNNRPEDIENQIYLFQDKRNSTLDIKNLQQFFKPLSDDYERLKQEETLDIKKVQKIFEKIRDHVVEPLVIRRTRRDIENNKEYLADLKEQKISFPKIKGPEAVRYEFDNKLSKLFSDTISYLTCKDDDGAPANGIEYYRYRAIEFLVKESDRKIYGNVGLISLRLAAIMKTLLVKRLESSFFAFKQSLKRFQKATANMIKWMENDQVPIAPDFDANDFLEEHTMEQFEEKINEIGGNNKIFKADAFAKDFLSNLKKDKIFIDELVNRWNNVGDKDPKMDVFIDKLKKTFLSEQFNPSGKLVIFTESKETAQYITKNLNSNGYTKILQVDASNRKTLENTITENFDANYEDGDETKWKFDYDIIITTEVLAEGINLHRSNTILNYDVPWNSTRLMQRIGRVNRIGTKAKHIYVYNFYPTEQAENQIRLSDIAIKKLQAFHSAFGEDNEIYSLLEEVGEGALYGSQIKEEESEILIFLNELRDFKKEHPDEFQKIFKLPARSRAGRKSEAVTNSPLTFNGATVVYLKSENHPGVFYFVSEKNNLSELSFLEAVKIFKALENEKPIPLHKNHHTHIQQGINFFNEDIQQQAIQSITKNSLSPVENSALRNIQTIIPYVPTPQKKAVLSSAMETIKAGGIKGLTNDVNRFFQTNSLNDVPAFIDKLFIDVMDGYNLKTTSKNGTAQRKPLHKPYIVLSESFE
ncbi:MAG: helicase-related protein [Bacteroidota bacterium]